MSQSGKAGKQQGLHSTDLNAHGALLHLASIRATNSDVYERSAHETGSQHTQAALMHHIIAPLLHASGMSEAVTRNHFTGTYRAAAAYADDQILQATHCESVGACRHHTYGQDAGL